MARFKYVMATGIITRWRDLNVVFSPAGVVASGLQKVSLKGRVKRNFVRIIVRCRDIIYFYKCVRQVALMSRLQNDCRLSVNAYFCAPTTLATPFPYMAYLTVCQPETILRQICFADFTYSSRSSLSHHVWVYEYPKCSLLHVAKALNF